MQTSNSMQHKNATAFILLIASVSIYVVTTEKLSAQSTPPQPERSREDKPSEDSENAALIDELIKQLSSTDEMARDSAAKRLRKIYQPPNRKRWDALLRETKPGDSKAEIMKRFDFEPADLEAGIGTGGSHMDVYRLDDRWLFRGWFQNSDDSLQKGAIVEKYRAIWQPPSDDYTGVWTSYFVNGQRCNEIDYKYGKYHGRFTMFHSNGRRSVVQNYIAHVAHGRDTGYYDTGEVQYRAFYNHGEQTGVWTWYEKDGSIRTEQDYGGHPRAKDVANMHQAGI